MFDFQSKTIIVTGAGSGIGQSTSIVLNRFGARVVLLDISEDGLNETTSKMIGDNYRCYVTDLSDINYISSLIVQIVEENGPISGLVHCAGISSRKPLNVLKKEGFSNIMDINFYSFVEMTKQLLKKGRMIDGSSIVVMSSISSIRGYKAKTEYCVSKAAVDAFVRCMALELAPKKIRINSVMPAVVNTPLTLKAQSTNSAVEASSEFIAPLGNSEPEEVANTIVFLLSNATRTITGTAILIDGGVSLL